MSETSAVNLDDLTDLAMPWAIRVAATLGIARHIAAGTQTIDGLAAAAGCDAEMLERLLGTLTSKGIFEQPSPGQYSLNEPARDLLDPARLLFLDLNGIGGRMAHAWGTLLNCVRTGVPAYHEVFGLPFWEDLAAHPEIAASFDALIGPLGHGTFTAEFDITGGWQDVHTVADVGGGTGAMLAAVLRARPHLRGTLVELPGTVARSAEVFQAAGVADRVTTSAQSFFDPLPPGADLYIVRHVLNDWADREAGVLLTRCADAARPNGRVVILDGVQQEGQPKRLHDETPLVGGGQRTLAEFRDLANRSRLTVVAAGRQPSGYFVIECRPV